MFYSDRKLAGTLAFIGAVQCIIGINVAEELYPGYSVSANPISDLGATCRTTCMIQEPASLVFNSAVIVLGALGITASYFLYRTTRWKLLTLFMALSGIGAIGVGTFPETTGVVHKIVSLIVFLFGGLAAVSSYRIQEAPLNYLSIILGVLALVALVLYSSGTYLTLGQGGMERMIAYPALLWFVGFGAYLMKS